MEEYLVCDSDLTNANNLFPLVFAYKLIVAFEWWNIVVKEVDCWTMDKVIWFMVRFNFWQGWPHFFKELRSGYF